MKGYETRTPDGRTGWTAAPRPLRHDAPPAPIGYWKACQMLGLLAFATVVGLLLCLAAAAVLDALVHAFFRAAVALW